MERSAIRVRRMRAIEPRSCPIGNRAHHTGARVFAGFSHDIDARVTPEVLDLTTRDGQVAIEFRIDIASYQFPTDGPVIEFTSPGSGWSITTIEVASDFLSARVVNVNQSGLAYSYLSTRRRIGNAIEDERRPNHSGPE